MEDPVTEVRLNVYEALLALCQTRSGRSVIGKEGYVLLLVDGIARESNSPSVQTLALAVLAEAIQDNVSLLSLLEIQDSLKIILPCLQHEQASTRAATTRCLSNLAAIPEGNKQYESK